MNVCMYNANATNLAGHYAKNIPCNGKILHAWYCIFSIRNIKMYYICQNHKDPWLRWLNYPPVFKGGLLEDIHTVDILELIESQEN